ncbi:MAG: hypothetical protein IJ746_05665 [Ruminococcus sp.]|nr:hypothetical protein [Ruminococcus sp.]
MKRSTVLLIALAVIGIVMGAVGLKDSIRIFKDDFSDLTAMKQTEFESGDLAEGELFLVIDQIATEETTRTYGFVPVSKSETPYYLVTNDECYFVISVGNKDRQKEFDDYCDKSFVYITDDTYTVPAPDGLKVSAKASDMNSEVRGYLEDYCKNTLGMSDADYRELVVTDVCLSAVQYSSMKWMPFIGFGIAALSIVILIVLKKRSSRF